MKERAQGRVQCFNIRNLMLLCIAAVAPVAVNAQAAPGGWYWSVPVRYVYAGHAGDRIAFAVNAPINHGTCPTMNNVVEFALDPQAPFFWQMYTLLVSAQKNATPINVYTDGSCSNYGVMARDISVGDVPH